MITLQLTAKGKEQELIKAYLEEHASEMLANKINNGSRIEKDGKTLLNKKTLEGFMRFANEEARKLAEKGARAACVEESVVYGWAIHYFEEDSIEEALYTLEGEPYKAAPKHKTVSPAPVSVPAKKKKESEEQITFFDLAPVEETTEEVEEAVDVEEVAEIAVEDDAEEEIEAPQISPLYKRYMGYTEQYPTTLVAMRVGDFYEMFGEAAIRVGNEIGLQVVNRDFGLEEKTPMIGFPYHAEELYRNKIQEFSAIAIIDSDTDMKFYLKKEKGHPAMRVDTTTGEITEERSSNVDDLIGILFGILKKDLEVKI